jgi:hypothetical protein
VRVAWHVTVREPETKRNRYVGGYASEEDAARAYDCAAVKAYGSGAKRNFPGEVVSELPETVGETRKVERKQRSSSRYIGVAWDKASSAWLVQLYEPRTQRSRYVGGYASEEDAARAYDCAAVKAHGPGANRNFPGEVVSEPPVTVGETRKEERKQRCTSRYIGVTWNKAGSSSSCRVQLYDPQIKRSRCVGSYASEEDAARACDFAAVQAHGPGAKRNFPGEAISEAPAPTKG